MSADAAVFREGLWEEQMLVHRSQRARLLHE